MAKQLIFVLGVGDSRHNLGKFVTRRWVNGFMPHYYVFGWDDLATSFDDKFDKFLAFLDSFPKSDELYLAGISAGGTAVVNALAARPKIRKVAMISSPFKVQLRSWRPALVSSIKHAQNNFATFTPATKQKMLNITGWRDGVVPTSLSQLPGVRSVHVPGFGHAMNIVLATVVTKRHLQNFLTQAP